MKKTLTVLAFLPFLLIPSVSSASALTNDQINALVSVLQAFGVSQETIAIVQGELTTTTVATVTPTTSVQTTPAPVAPQPTFGAVQTQVAQSNPNVTLEVLTSNCDDVSCTHPASTTTTADSFHFTANVYKDGAYIKLPVTVTTNDPDLPSQFQINAPGQIGWFCVAPAYPDFPNHGCQTENPVSKGTYQFTFAVNDYSASTTKTVEVK